MLMSVSRVLAVHPAFGILSENVMSTDDVLQTSSTQPTASSFARHGSVVCVSWSLQSGGIASLDCPAPLALAGIVIPHPLQFVDGCVCLKNFDYARNMMHAARRVRWLPVLCLPGREVKSANLTASCARTSLVCRHSASSFSTHHQPQLALWMPSLPRVCPSAGG